MHGEQPVVGKLPKRCFHSITPFMLVNFVSVQATHHVNVCRTLNRFTMPKTISSVDRLTPNLTWNFSQVFGDRVEPDDEIADADIISAVKFSHNGDYLATGDRGGRVVLFHRNFSDVGSPAEYHFFTEFQSHEPEFDYLKSLEIEEKINQIEWLRRRNSAHLLLTTNDKTIKLWKVTERQATALDAQPDTDGVSIPRIRRTGERLRDSRPKRAYANAHAYHINSISLNSDDETFISADDLRINLWNIEIPDQSFNIVDIKPDNMDELAEVITCSQLHPTECNTFVYGSSRGIVKLGDMRASALCDQHSKKFEAPIDAANRSFFSEIISSVSDVKFSHDGQYFLSRDYLTIKIWDLRMEDRPLHVLNVHDHLKPRLCDLYENDSIFDKFEACWSGDDKQVMTGSYHNHFHVFDVEKAEDVILQASRDAIEGPTHVLTPVQVLTGGQQARTRSDVHADNLNFSLKIMQAAWHPSRPIMALAAVNNLYLFRQ
eukprot:m.354878 g.354878  ORF g.354878 m.354878 type:complete len:489 (-) comp17129_c0_seq1:479-1945(-)